MSKAYRKWKKLRKSLGLSCSFSKFRAINRAKERIWRKNKRELKNFLSQPMHRDFYSDSFCDEYDENDLCQVPEEERIRQANEYWRQS